LPRIEIQRSAPVKAGGSSSRHGAYGTLRHAGQGNGGDPAVAGHLRRAFLGLFAGPHSTRVGAGAPTRHRLALRGWRRRVVLRRHPLLPKPEYLANGVRIAGSGETGAGGTPAHGPSESVGRRVRRTQSVPALEGPASRPRAQDATAC